MATVITIKLRQADSNLWLRRTVEYPGFTLSDFNKWVSESLPKLDVASLSVTYSDQDGDDCAISTAGDFHEAMDMCRRLGTSLRVQVIGTELTTSDATTTAAVSPVAPVMAAKEEAVKDGEEEDEDDDSEEDEEEEETTEDDEDDVDGGAAAHGPSAFPFADLAAAGLAELQEALRDSSSQGQPFVTRMARCPLVRQFITRARQEQQTFLQAGGAQIIEGLTELVRAAVAASLEQQDGGASGNDGSQATNTQGGEGGAATTTAEREVVEERHEGHGAAVHHGVKCDGCKVQPIVGIRYKDAIRLDYDLCEACEAKDDTWHPFFVITDPLQVPSPTLEVVCRRTRAERHHQKKSRGEPAMHVRVTCNGCGGSPIFGNRYKCTERHDYDLCEECYKADATGIPFLKVKKPWAAPVRINRGWGGRRGGRHAALSAFVQAMTDARDQRHENRHQRRQQRRHQKQQQQSPASQEEVPPTQTEEEKEAQAAVAALHPAVVAAPSVETPATNNETESGVVDTAAVSPVPAPHTPEDSPLGGRGFGFGHRMSRPAGSYRRLVARFIDDKTIPDGTILPPNTPFLKTWIVSNRGLIAFPEGTRLIFTYGNQMQGPIDGVEVGPIEPDADFELTVPLVSPAEAGRYQGYWQLEAPAMEEGQASTKFGPHLFVDILVDATLVDEWQVVVEERAEVQGETARVVPEEGPTAAEIERWSVQLKALSDMGFVDVAANVDMLDKYFEEGGLDVVVDKLLSF